MKRRKQNLSEPAELVAAMDANAAAYRRAVQASAPGECWDYLVLTAANEKQAEGYRMELALRQRAVGPAGPFFPQVQRTLVVPDSPGHKAGSGGATLGSVRALSRQFGLGPDDLLDRRILLIHSGGMSQRLPMYSALGKIFSPLPLLRPDGQIATLFDHLYVTLAGLPERLGPGMLVLAGDVFLLFDHRHVTAPPPGVTAISMRVDADLGRGHGVFVPGADGSIRQTLQKVTVEEMKRRGAADATGRVLIDTGLLFFDPERVKTLEALSRTLRATTEVDLYDDMTAALAAETEPDAYLRAGRSRSVRDRLWQSLHAVPFRAAEVAGEFLHLGTTRQFRDAMVGWHPSPAAALFQQNVLAHCEWPVPRGSRVYQSALLRKDGRAGTVGPACVVEHSLVYSASSFGRGSVVSQSVVPREIELKLGPDLLLFQVPVSVRRDTHFANVICGVDDDFKNRFADGLCTYLNRPIAEWFARHGVAPKKVWPGVPAGEWTLWNARLFPVGELSVPSDALLLTLTRKAPRGRVRRWLKAPRMSMAQILGRADRAEMIARREMIAALLQAEEAVDRIRGGDDRPADGAIGNFATPHAYPMACHVLLKAFQNGSAEPAELLRAARATWTAAQLCRRPDFHPSGVGPPPAEGYERSAFERVSAASEAGYPSRPLWRRGKVPRLAPGREVTATAPARLDLAGGWSDTPPYCFERGGHVVNVAIDLDGRPPVSATVRTLSDAVVVLESHDLAEKVELSDRDAAGPVDVHDPFALHKVALRTARLLEDGVPLREQLRKLGAGLHVTTEARVPKGSGLGTSSILAATLLAALRAAAGRKPAHSQLVEQTLLLEQRLGTGGGWQDQVGGVAPGVKSTTTGPGIPQRPQVEVLKLSDGQLLGLQERLVVYYSGQQRLARDILRQVMGRWLAREPAVVALMNDLKQSAAALRLALLRGTWHAAAEQINRYWQIKKALYPGSTTPAIDLLLLEMKDACLAAGLAGAGGGGFAYFLCRDKRQATLLRARLAERSARPGMMGTVYETQINREGLRVTRSKQR